MRTHWYPKLINILLASVFSSTDFELNIHVVGNVYKYYIYMHIGIHCKFVCRIYESVHIKTGIDLFTKHKANITQISSKFIKTSHTNISCINCNLVTVLPWVYFFNLCHSTYIYMYTAFTQ